MSVLTPAHFHMLPCQTATGMALLIFSRIPDNRIREALFKVKIDAPRPSGRSCACTLELGSGTADQSPQLTHGLLENTWLDQGCGSAEIHVHSDVKC